MKKTAFFLCFIITITCCAQDYEHIRLENFIYNNDFKSVELYRVGYPISFPIITLQSGEKLQLAFDDVHDQSRYLKYTFIHCTHDWKPDGLSPIEYLEGFTEDEITDFSHSFNTIMDYTHYELLFPTEMMRIIKSGNYILYVYDETPDNPVLTRRFVVIEPYTASIEGIVKKASDVNYMYHKQEVDFWTNTGSYRINNPAMYLHATILQNGRWQNAITGLRYRFGKPGEYSFDYDDNSNVFDGSSEFRAFDMKSLKYNGTHIVSVDYRQHENQVYVLEDLARPYGPYVSENTLCGKCYYKNEDYDGKNREDYVRVHFTLRTDFNVDDGDLYVFGALTDWRILPEARLKKNPKTGLWETSLVLKQGYYNYQYVYVPYENPQIIDETYIEGNHWETNNEYAIFLYYQEEGTSYDKLIGYKTLKMGD